MNTIRTENILACIICGRAAEEIYSGLQDCHSDVPGTFGFSRCISCGILWLNHRPIFEDKQKCYQQNYYTHERDDIGSFGYQRPFALFRDTLKAIILCGFYGYRHLHNRHALCFLGAMLAKVHFLRARAISGLKELFPHFIKGGFIIDVGCGNSNYLKIMIEMGWKVLGVEPDYISATIARDKGIPVFIGALEQARLPDFIADQITMTHVIEHLHEPLSAINECHRILKTGGRLVIYTPNSESLGSQLFRKFWSALDTPRHMFIFSARSIRLLFEKTLFKKVYITTSASSAKNIYDDSVLILKKGKINLKNPRQRGRSWFGIKESILCHLGKECGEEIEVVAIK